jgi:ComF family protein
LSTAGELLGDLEALALPAACLGCGRFLPADVAGAGLCGVCGSRMRRLAAPGCERCGQPLDTWEVRAGGETRPRCGFCRAWPDSVAWAASAVWMVEGPARELVHALKYGGWRVAAGPMAAAVVRSCGARLRGVELLVPVPLGARRQRERGYNQAAVLARALGERVGARVDERALVRVRETRTQTTLGPAERWRNVEGAFAPARALAGVKVAVVDDVLTTGATLAACAAALAAGGAGAAGAVTFARAAVPD